MFHYLRNGMVKATETNGKCNACISPCSDTVARRAELHVGAAADSRLGSKQAKKQEIQYSHLKHEALVFNTSDETTDARQKGKERTHAHARARAHVHARAHAHAHAHARAHAHAYALAHARARARARAHAHAHARAHARAHSHAHAHAHARAHAHATRSRTRIHTYLHSSLEGVPPTEVSFFLHSFLRSEVQPVN